MANKIWAIWKAAVGHGAKFWWRSDCICPVCLKLLAITAVVPRIVKKTPYMTGGVNST